MNPTCALIFPPLWYYASLPPDLSYTAGALIAAGIDTFCWDLSAGLNHHLLGKHPAFAALRSPNTYSDLATIQGATSQLEAKSDAIGRPFGAEYGTRGLTLGGLDPTHLPSITRVGLNSFRNPALPFLKDQAQEVVATNPPLIAIACVHPEQLVFAPLFGRLLRLAGYEGLLVLYGCLEDVLSPQDLAPDLMGKPRHLLFDDFDGVILGEAETALVELCSRSGHDLSGIPNFLWREQPHRTPLPHREDLKAHPGPDFSWARPEHYPYPQPVIDLRLGRGCTWGRCAFCAIQAHHPGYRSGSVEAVGEGMARAHEALGSTMFRLRDELLTPVQLRRLADVVATLPFPAHWMARMRFQPGLTREILEHAASTGLSELWMGLESAVPRVRNLMGKGVEQDVVERLIDDVFNAGIRLRLLCIVGFPGERVDEAEQTGEFLARYIDKITLFSLTPFQLMRYSPMVAHPGRYGLLPVPSPHPSHERLLFQLPVASSTQNEVEEVYERLVM
ncbi:MAG: hypothetical protein HN348_05970, partial [Proteobacteria bacterium]|nr:hypothetical protein [Pseudomonadota bacterium]